VIFDSSILDFASRRNFRGIQKVEVSQRKLNCALFVKNSLIKNFPKARKSGGNLNLQDRTNLDQAYGPGSGKNGQNFRHFSECLDKLCPVAAMTPAPNFYGEFDSGSERTLAAWIRHASRTRLSAVAIQLKV
jgi:hypothetical protein